MRVVWKHKGAAHLKSNLGERENSNICCTKYTEMIHCTVLTTLYIPFFFQQKVCLFTICVKFNWPTCKKGNFVIYFFFCLLCQYGFILKSPKSKFIPFISGFVIKAASKLEVTKIVSIWKDGRKLSKYFPFPFTAL